jgi:DNA-binding transcriptional ArsR family regulator
MSPKQDKPVTEAAVVRALAHTLRVRILGILDERTASATDIATEIGAPLGNVAYHVRTLASLGMIKRVGQRRRRGAIESFYKADVRPVITDQTWSQVPEVVKQAMVQANLGTTGLYVQHAAQTGGFSRKDAHLSRTSIQVDEESWKELSVELAECFAKIRKAADRTAKRLARADAEDVRTATVVLMLFEGGEPVIPAPASGHRRHGSTPAHARTTS